MARSAGLLLALAFLVFAGCSQEQPAAPADGGKTAAGGPAAMPGPANAAVKGQKKTVDFVTVGLPLITKNCTSCHSGTAAKGGLDLSTIKTKEDAVAMKEKLDKAASLVESRRMPPRQAAQPTAEERDQLVAALRSL